MTYDLTATLDREVAKLSGTYPLDMYVINASLSGYDPLYYVNLNQDVYGYAIDSNGDMQNSEVVYTGLPIQRESLKTDLQGGGPTINLSIPNTDRVIEAVIQNNNYLRSRDITFLTTFGPFLPSGNTDYRYIGSTSDKNAVMKEKLYIDSVQSNENAVTFSCKTKFSLRQAVLPKKKFTRECSWLYLSSECDPSSSVDSVTYPTCDYTLEQCRERANSNRYGGFPGIPNRFIQVI